VDKIIQEILARHACRCASGGDIAEITVADEVTNLNPQPEEYALLYHCNFGYPFLNEKTRLLLPDRRRTTPRTPWAETLMGRETGFDKPNPGEEERVFFHEDMERRAALVSESTGMKMTLTWSDTLPILAHWRSMASGDYACGLEPTNCYIMGRSAERQNGTLPVLAPFETVKTSIRLQFEHI